MTRHGDLSTSGCTSDLIRFDTVQVHDLSLFFFFQAEDGIRDYKVTGVQTCALPISARCPSSWGSPKNEGPGPGRRHARRARSEEHTSELQSPCNLVCRLLLENKRTSISSLAWRAAGPRRSTNSLSVGIRCVSDNCDS